MALDLWTHQFCLACDKQVHSDGDAYCSESCRLADQETPTPSSGASSPALAPSHGLGWSASPRPSRKTLYLPPPFDFGPPSRGRPYESELRHHDPTKCDSNLTPSSSHSSLCSMQSTTSSIDATHLSDKSRKELKAYAISFEQVWLQRRRSHSKRETLC